MPPQRTIIGIDPGKSGGLALLSHEGDVLAVSALEPKTEQDIATTLAGWQTAHGPCAAFLEKVHSSPQMGVASAFKFGRMLGNVHMACVALHIRLEWVTPQKWQKKLGLKTVGKGIGKSDTEKKNRNKARAQELFPGIKITHAIADALLIAEYGRRTLTEATDEG